MQKDPGYYGYLIGDLFCVDSLLDSRYEKILGEEDET